MLARLGSATLFSSQICLHPEVVSFKLGIHSQLTQLWFDAVAQILVSSSILDAVVYPARPPAATPDGLGLQ